MGTLALSATSCSDSWLDQEPSTAVETDKVVNVLTDVEFLLNGIYNTMQDASAYSGRLVYYADATGDDMQQHLHHLRQLPRSRCQHNVDGH